MINFLLDAIAVNSMPNFLCTEFLLKSSKTPVPTVPTPAIAILVFLKTLTNILRKFLFSDLPLYLLA